MQRKRLIYTKCIIFVIFVSLLLCSCGKNNDLPEGAEYLEPIWFENLTEYCTGNYNNISEFKNGYAVASFAQMGEYWSVSDERSAIIDKNGEIIIGPLEGDLFIDVVDDKSFYIQDNDLRTSKIVDINNNVIGSFDGILKKREDGEIFNEDGLSYLCYNNIISQTPYENRWSYGLARKSGQVVVPCEYSEIISNVTDKHIVFLNDSDGESADVYNSDGSFSHSIYSDYKISDYAYGLLILHSNDGYGVADIYGNVMVEVNNSKVEILSEKCIIVSKDNSKDSILMDNDGKVIKSLELSPYHISKMDNGVFMLSDGFDTYLITSKGEIVKKYEKAQYPSYCGDGIFSFESGNSYYNREIQLVNGKTGEIIGEKYNDNNDIKFDEKYAVVEDLEGNTFVIDTDGNRYCDGYNISGNVSDRVVQIYNDKIAGIICLPPKK